MKTIFFAVIAGFLLFAGSIDNANAIVPVNAGITMPAGFVPYVPHLFQNDREPSTPTDWAPAVRQSALRTTLGILDASLPFLSRENREKFLPVLETLRNETPAGVPEITVYDPILTSFRNVCVLASRLLSLRLPSMENFPREITDLPTDFGNAIRELYAADNLLANATGQNVPEVNDFIIRQSQQWQDNKILIDVLKYLMIFLGMFAFMILVATSGQKKKPLG